LPATNLGAALADKERESVAVSEQGSSVPTNLLGIFCVIGAGAAFTTNDMAIKWLSGDYPLHEIILARSLIAILLTLAILVPFEGGYRNLLTRRWRLHLLP
jgi:drug/metabolite transporter (DMT)-like permease